MVHWENFKLMGELMILKLEIEKCEALLITLNFFNVVWLWLCQYDFDMMIHWIDFGFVIVSIVWKN